jgi:hypothetical protein
MLLYTPPGALTNQRGSGIEEPSMKSDMRSEHATRDSMLDLSFAETAARLSDGDEYLDLEQLAEGVQKSVGRTTPTGRLLPRRAVREDMWRGILTQLAAPPIATVHATQ